MSNAHCTIPGMPLSAFFISMYVGGNLHSRIRLLCAFTYDTIYQYSGLCELIFVPLDHNYELGLV